MPTAGWMLFGWLGTLPYPPPPTARSRQGRRCPECRLHCCGHCCARPPAKLTYGRPRLWAGPGARGNLSTSFGCLCLGWLLNAPPLPSDVVHPACTHGPRLLAVFGEVDLSQCQLCSRRAASTTGGESDSSRQLEARAVSEAYREYKTFTRTQSPELLTPSTAPTSLYSEITGLSFFVLFRFCRHLPISREAVQSNTGLLRKWGPMTTCVQRAGMSRAGPGPHSVLHPLCCWLNRPSGPSSSPGTVAGH